MSKVLVAVPSGIDPDTDLQKRVRFTGGEFYPDRSLTIRVVEDLMNKDQTKAIVLGMPNTDKEIRVDGVIMNNGDELVYPAHSEKVNQLLDTMYELVEEILKENYGQAGE